MSECNVWIAAWIEAIATGLAVLVAVVGFIIGLVQWRAAEKLRAESLNPVLVAGPGGETGYSQRDTWISIKNFGQTSASEVRLWVVAEIIRREQPDQPMEIEWESRKNALNQRVLPYDFLAPGQTVTSRWFEKDSIDPIEDQSLKARYLNILVEFTDTQGKPHSWRGVIKEDFDAH